MKNDCTVKSEILLEAIGKIDDRLIYEAAPMLYHPSSQPAERKVRKKIKWSILPAAACLLLLVIGGLGLSLWSDSAKNSEDLPFSDSALPLLAAGLPAGAMGFEGYMVYDISELNNANPWSAETELKELPVYRNLAFRDSSGISIHLSDEEMMKIAKETASAAGTVIDKTEFQTDDRYGDKPYSLRAYTRLGLIDVYGNGSVSISFKDDGISLPSGYSFTYSLTSDKEAEKTIEYLTASYAQLLNFESPIISTWGDYSFSGEKNRKYLVYDKGKDYVGDILNFNFHTAGFSPLSDEKNSLYYIHIPSKSSYTEELGSYPVISSAEAKELLLDGEYFTSVPYTFEGGNIKEKDIAKTELIYYNSSASEIFMPYYFFYVDLSGSDMKAADSNIHEGLITYGAYYVPAVESRYLTNFPVKHKLYQ